MTGWLLYLEEKEKDLQRGWHFAWGLSVRKRPATWNWRIFTDRGNCSGKSPQVGTSLTRGGITRRYWKEGRLGVIRLGVFLQLCYNEQVPQSLFCPLENGANVSYLLGLVWIRFNTLNKPSAKQALQKLWWLLISQGVNILMRAFWK